MGSKGYFLIVALTTYFVGSAVAASFAGPRIEWEVGNRYRAFDYKAGVKQSAEQSAKQFEGYRQEAGENVEGWFKRIIEQQHSPYIADPGPWNESTGKYEKDFVNVPKLVFVKAHLVTDKDRTEVLTQKPCIWRISTNETSQPCNDPFVIAGFDSGGAKVSVLQDGVEIASAEIKPDFKIILGLGDSYAAGEGNPDSPTKWEENAKRKWPPVNDTATGDRVLKTAQWWSNRCDRSFYSYQSLAALHVASANPHAVVAFVHLACSGAEIIDGLLAPQRFPPGHSMHRCQPPFERSDPNKWDKQCDVPYSQLNAAVDLLCPEASKPLESDKINKIKSALKGIWHNKAQVNWLNEQPKERLRFCQKPLRKIDYVLISIGGNDVGFSGLIGDALLPRDTHIRTPLLGKLAKQIVQIVQKEGKVVCPYLPAGTSPEDLKRQKQCREYGLSAQTRIHDIPQRYRALKLALEEILQMDPHEKTLTPDKIILNLYPNPLYKTGGALCGNPGGSNDENEWRAIHTVLPPSKSLFGLLTLYNWEVNFTADEARDVEGHVINPLNRALKEIGQEFGWQVISTESAMKDRGWCTGNSRCLSHVNPTEWSPYTSRSRFIRTANDSLLTQWPRTTMESESKDSKIIERENGFYGMFHPNAQGHAAIAKVLVDQTQIASSINTEPMPELLLSSSGDKLLTLTQRDSVADEDATCDSKVIVKKNK